MTEKVRKGDQALLDTISNNAQLCHNEIARLKERFEEVHREFNLVGIWICKLNARLDKLERPWWKKLFKGEY